MVILRVSDAAASRLSICSKQVYGKGMVVVAEQDRKHRARAPKTLAPTRSNCLYTPFTMTGVADTEASAALFRGSLQELLYAPVDKVGDMAHILQS